jgi:hypothetical protein
MNWVVSVKGKLEVRVRWILLLSGDLIDPTMISQLSLLVDG